MVFVGNGQMSPIASHLQGLDPSFVICCQGPALTCITEGRQDERRLKASYMFLPRHMIVGLEITAVVWTILERISGLDPSLEMIDPRYLKFSTASIL